MYVLFYGGKYLEIGIRHLHTQIYIPKTRDIPVLLSAAGNLFDFLSTIDYAIEHQ